MCDEPETTPEKKSPWMICPVCEGDGTTVNPAIDGNGLTAEDFSDDPDFREDYFSGKYDIQCRACNGTGKIRESEVEELEQAAEDRALAAREDGNFEAYQHARDWRYGK
jgi:RecJ-like exonuclease